MAHDGISRRRAALALAGLGLSACAAPLAPAFLVNLAQLQAPVRPPAAGAGFAAGKDFFQRMTAPVRINGQGPFSFVVDTGANRTVVSTELALRLGLPDAGPANIHGVAGVEPAPTAGIDLLEVDQVASRGLRAPLLPQERLGADGLLGVDVLKDRRVIMDFARDQLSIAPERNRGEPTDFDMRQAETGLRHDLGTRVAVPARYRFGQLIIIGANVARRPVTAFIDSGSQSTVGNGALRALTLDPKTGPKPLRYQSPILSATGQTAEGELAVMPLLKIGGLNISGLMTVFADLHVFDIWDLTRQPSLLLGMDVIRRFNAIELNYPRREVAFYLRGDQDRPGL